MVSSIYLQLAVFSKTTKKTKLPGQKKQKSSWSMMHEGFAIVYLQSQYDTTPFFLFRTYLYDARMRRPGCCPGA